MAKEKLTKILSHFENKQPNCTLSFIFVFQLSAFSPKLSVYINFGQKSNKDWGQPTENLFASKYPTLFVGLLSKTVVIFSMFAAQSPPCSQNIKIDFIVLLSFQKVIKFYWNSY
jgi:hypothetical protein